MTVYCSPCGQLVDTETFPTGERYPVHADPRDGKTCCRSGEPFVPPWAQSG